MALSEQIPTMTAYSNDVGYDVVFSEPLRNFAQPDDVFMAETWLLANRSKQSL